MMETAQRDVVAALAAEKTRIDARIEALLNQYAALPQMQGSRGSYRKNSLGLIGWGTFFVSLFLLASIFKKTRAIREFLRREKVLSPYILAFILAVLVALLVKFLAKRIITGQDRKAAAYNAGAEAARDALTLSNKEIEAEVDALMKRKKQIVNELGAAAPGYRAAYLYPEAAAYVFDYLSRYPNAGFDEAFLQYEIECQ